MPSRGAPALPPGAYPRFAGLGDVLRLFSGDRATHGIPPGTHWTWLAFPESWPLVSPDLGNYTGPGTALGPPGDLWWFTLAEMSEHAPGAIPAWVERLLVREAEQYVGALGAAFLALGSVPLLWTVPDYGAPMVAAYQPHYRLAFGGPLFTDEEWSCRLNITSSGTLPDSTAADGMLPDLVAAIGDWVADAGAYLSTATGLSWVKFNEIASTGLYVDAGASRTAEVSPIVYGSTSPILPPQVAVVVSLRTAHSRGKAHAGRMFTPALSCSGSAGYCVNAANIGVAATTLLNAINAIVTPAGVSIISSTGESNHVTRVAVGRIFDTMRSRRRSLAEAPYDIGAALA